MINAKSMYRKASMAVNAKADAFRMIEDEIEQSAEKGLFEIVVSFQYGSLVHKFESELRVELVSNGYDVCIWVENLTYHLKIGWK